MRKLLLTLAASLCLSALQSHAITIGQGPAIGTDKRGTVWYEEFQDWSSNDVRVVSPNDNEFKLNDQYDPSRDIIAFYSHDGGSDGNYYFRVDFFDLLANAENGNLDVYVLIDCASGGTNGLPDSVQGTTDHPWEIAVKVYDSVNKAVATPTSDITATSWVGAYWRADLDGVEFGIKRQALLNAGWNGSSPVNFQVFTTKDFNTTLIDTVNSFNRTTKVLSGVVTSTNTIRTAKYAAIAHANQSLGNRTQTEAHIYNGAFSGQNLYPGFVRTLDSHTMLNVPLNMHISGTLLSSFLWARSADSTVDGPTFLNRINSFIQGGQGALIGGVYAEHIMPYFEGQVNQSSIAAFNDLAQTIFGLSTNDMKVMHVPERVIHSNTNWPHANPDQPLTGKPFQDILAGGYQATYLDEVSHLHWWFYPDETNSFNNCCATGNERWAGFGGCNERAYHHKIHKINGVYCFMINDREDQEKFGPQDGGMANDTRYTLLDKALQANDPTNPGGYAQLTLVFDDWEAYAGNSFASPTPNNNADQWHQTIRWAANHPWIQVCKLKDVLAWAQSDTNWVVDHGYVYDRSLQTYEWLKRASQLDYDHWYYGQNSLEENFSQRVPATGNNSTYYIPGTKAYGDLNSPGTLVRDSWDKVQAMPTGNLRKLAEWEYSAMIYETAWHDEDADPNTYHSRNYQWSFDVNDGCTTSTSDTTYDSTSGWAIRLHGHVRSVGILADAAQWVQDVRNGVQGPTTIVQQKDVDDDLWDEYILKNNKVYLCFKRWGGRLVAAFVYNPTSQDATEVIGQPVANPAQESDEEDADNTRCSAFKDRWASSAANPTNYVDMDYAATPPVQGSNYWEFVSQDGGIRKRMTLPNGRDTAQAQYTLGSGIGTLYVRHGFGPNQLDLLHFGDQHLTISSDSIYYGLANSQGGAVYAVNGYNCARSSTSDNGTLPNAGYQNREFPLVQQVEQYTTSSNATLWLAFSLASAQDIDGDGLSNQQEISLGTDYQNPDTDGNGLPDGWEYQYFGTPTGTVASADADGDGMSNLQEYLASTNPKDRNSVFRITSIMPGSGTAQIVTWNSVTNKAYTVFYCDDLVAQNWQPVAGGSITASGASAACTDAPPSNILQRFYRVKVTP
jgi:hypothetical protein